MDKLSINKGLLNAEQTKRITQLIEDKIEAFATQPDEMGNTDLVEHDIEIMDGAKPIVQRLRRLPFSVRVEITKKIQELLDLAVIKPADSDWASPIVPVRKKDGSIRMCIDYRALNKVTRKDNSPLAQLNELLDRAGMSGNKIFSSFDLMAGYHQVKMSARARRVSTFISHLGTFEWVRMPFGLCNAPATFSNLMRKVLATIQSNAVFAYLDDVLVASKTVDEHITHVEEMLDRFIQVGLTIQPKKSFLFQEELEFLGFLVSKDGIKATTSKLQAITDFPQPATVKQMKGFVALCSYYRRFVKEFSKIAKPLTDALRNKPGELVWTKDMHQAFLALKKTLVTPPVLAYPQVGERYWLECDGSKKGLGCVLSQMQTDGKLHPVAFGSRAVSRAEERYGATDLEACAVIFGLEHFDVYIRGHPLTVVTDHRALTHILRSNQKLSSDRQQRWRNRFMGQEIDVVYRAGRNHIVPDVLSRQIRENTRPSADSTPLETDKYEDLAWVELCPTEQAQDGWEWLLHMNMEKEETTTELLARMRREQRKDPFVRRLFQFRETGDVPTDPADRHWVIAYKDKCTIREGLLYYEVDRKRQHYVPVVPQQMREEILREAHSAQTGGHFSAQADGRFLAEEVLVASHAAGCHPLG